MNKQENYGKRWVEEDETTLKQLFKDGVSVEEIAEALGRTRSSILGRLAYHQLIQWDNQVLQYFKIVWLGK